MFVHSYVVQIKEAGMDQGYVIISFDVCTLKDAVYPKKRSVRTLETVCLKSSILQGLLNNNVQSVIKVGRRVHVWPSIIGLHILAYTFCEGPGADLS